MFDLKQLDVQLDDDDLLDDLDDLDLDDGDLIAMEFLDQAAKVNPETLTRRDVHQLKELLREHPAVGMILDDWNSGATGAAAEKTLEALVSGWGMTTTPGGRKAASVSLEALSSHLGECAWPGCSLPRKQRRGTRGRHPRHCHGHTIEAKRKADRERLRVKRSGTLKLRECCRQWQQTGRRDRCQQCRDYEAASKPAYPLSAIEAAYLSEGGFHLV